MTYPSRVSAVSLTIDYLDRDWETGHVSHTFYGRRVCAVNVIMDSTF